MEDQVKLGSRILGCLLGGAIGNAMGSIVENWQHQRIEKVYGRIEMPLDLGRLRTEDDHRIAMLFTRTYLALGRNITPEDLAETWKREFTNADQFFWCLRNAVELLRRGVSPRQTGLYNINTGSAIMAIAPVGIFNMMEPDRAWADALDLAYMYQPKPDAHCAAALAAGIAAAFIPGASPDDVCRAILEHSLDEDIVFWNDRDKPRCNIKEAVSVALKIAAKHGDDWWNARDEIVGRLGQWHPIEPIEVLAITTCLFKMTSGDYEKGVVAGTNIGRDSDTIANLVGSLAGAMHGIEGIPREWVDGVQEVNLDLYKEFESVSHRFTRVIREKRARYGRICRQIDEIS